ncbi:thioredoxin domain-containing protein [Ferriphaselus sp. R-1]|uniref:DsbA family protein n=1 Tax=Ferriphaselus sp. R-1 TaxID=1485544 RepID=UPI0009DD15DC|nr:thioredoxin domain-containing protein [Ferriphaselus sp. R-1]
MKRSLMALMLGSLIVTPAYATSPEDALLERLEASGKLDAAIDRALERRIAREKKQREDRAHADQAAELEAARKIQPLGKNDRIHGPENARISIIVMSDPECPYCQRLAGIPEQAVDQSKGLANVGIRLFPLDFHGQKAVDAALTALCVADQAGAPGYYKFFNGYLAATQGNGQGIPDRKGKPAKAVLDKLLKTAGVQDLAKLHACQQDKQTLKRLEAEFNTTVEAGATGTPYLVLRNNENGEVKVLAGVTPLEMLLDEINKLAGPTTTAK